MAPLTAYSTLSDSSVLLYYTFDVKVSDCCCGSGLAEKKPLMQAHIQSTADNSRDFIMSPRSHLTLLFFFSSHES